MRGWGTPPAARNPPLTGAVGTEVFVRGSPETERQVDALDSLLYQPVDVAADRDLLAFPNAITHQRRHDQRPRPESRETVEELRVFGYPERFVERAGFLEQRRTEHHG